MPTTAVDNLGAVGLVADKEPTSLPPNAWTDLQNARCVDRSIASFKGYSDLGNAAGVVPQVMIPVFDGDSSLEITNGSYLLYGGNSASGGKIYAYSPYWGGSGEITGDTLSAGGTWDGTVLGGVGVIHNGIDNPRYWSVAFDGTSLQDTIKLPYDETKTEVCYWDDVQFSCKVLRTFRYHLFAMNIIDCDGENPRKVHWSHPAEPGTIPITWDPTLPDYDAGFVELSDTPGAIIDGLAMRDSFQIYKDDAIYAVTYTGRYSVAEPIWNFRLVTTSTGIYGRRLVCDIGGQHVFVGDGDIYLYNGTDFKSIADERVKNFFFNNISRTNRDNSYMIFNERTAEVWLCYPEAGNEYCTKALVWDKNQNTWSTRTLPGTTAAVFTDIRRGYTADGGFVAWEDLTCTWEDWGTTPETTDWTAWNDPLDKNSIDPFDNRLVMCSSSTFYEFDHTDQAAGVNQECYARRTHLDLGDKADWHMVLQIYPRATGDAFQVRVGSVDVAEGSTTWSDYQTFTPGTDYKLDFRVTGRMHSIEFYSNADVSWSVESYEMDYVPAGRR